MKILDIARRARRSLSQAKARTILTSLAIGVGAFTITLSLAAGVGGKKYTEDIVRSNTDPLSIMVSVKQEQQEGPAEYNPDKAGGSSTTNGVMAFESLAKDDIKKIESVANINSVEPNVSPTPTYVTRDGQQKYKLPVLVAYDSALKFKFDAGDPKGSLADNEVIITDEYREALGFSSSTDAIGKDIKIAASKVLDVTGVAAPQEFTYKVVAVIGESNIVAAAGGSVYANFETLKQLNNYIYEGTNYTDSYMFASAKVDDESNIASVKAELEKMGYEAQSAEDLMQFIFQFINVLQGILLGFGALAVLTAIFGIINTQYISVLERTQQIGLMKALGMRRRDVGRLFKFEAAWIGFLGGAIGSGLAYATGLIANPYITKALTLDEGTNLLLFPVWIFASVIIGLMIVSVAAGILPARKAAKLDPIEALRTE